MDWLLCSSSTKGCCGKRCNDPAEFLQEGFGRATPSSSASSPPPQYRSGWARHVQEMFPPDEPSSEKSVFVVSRPVLRPSPAPDKELFFADSRPPSMASDSRPPSVDQHPAIIAASDGDMSSTGGTGACNMPNFIPSERASPVMHVSPPVKQAKDAKALSEKIVQPHWPTRFPSRPQTCIFSRHLWDRLELLFTRMDTDFSGTVTREKSYDFFNAYKQVCATGRFKEVDVCEFLDADGAITAESFIKFWTYLRESCSEDAILEEVDEIIDGSKWIDWRDIIDINPATTAFPERPAFCRLSSAAWSKCAELWAAIANGSDQITRVQSMNFFKGGFSSVSTEAMFKEVNMCGNGSITPFEFMAFWVHVSGLGYSDKAIIEEVSLLLNGGTWLDWTADLRFERTEDSDW